MALSGPLPVVRAPVQIPRPRQDGETTLRVALVHERFTDWAGSEKVVEQMVALWPDATLHAALCDREILPPALQERPIATSGLQRSFERVGRYEYLLPAIPRAFTRMALPADNDLVVVSHHAFANRITLPAGIPVLSYVYSPARWMWEPSMLTAERGPWLLRKGLGVWARGQRAADRTAAQRSSAVVAISTHVQERISRWWGLDSQVLHPPVDTTYYCPSPVPREDFLLLAGRLVPYKRPDIAIRAAIASGQHVVVAGDGRMYAELQELAGDRVTFVGRVSDSELRDLYRRCAAFLFAGEEDFGLVMAEAQACGAPVIARGIGGAVDIVQPGVNGVLYQPHVPGDDGEIAALAGAIAEFRGMAFDSAAIVASAERFSQRCFRTRLLEIATDVAGRSGTAVGAA